MSNSPLVDYVRISPNSTNPRNHKIDTIIIHHMAGNLSVESCGAGFSSPAREASSNYAIGTDGRVGMYVEEANRSWCSSNREVDHRGISIEVANDSGSPDWHVSDKALAKLIDLCEDICRRNGIPRLNFTGDKTGNLTMHKYYAATACPGPYLGSKFPYIAEQVNARLGVTGDPQTPQTPTQSTKTWRVQIGAYSTEGGAEKQRDAVEAAGFDAYVVQVDGILWRVQVGNYQEKVDAEQLLDRLRAAGFPGLITTLGGNPVTSTPTTPNTEEVVEVKVSVLKKDKTGPQVKALQALLIGYGYDLGRNGADGDFGPVTDSCVRKFQSRNGLETDGSVGPATWKKLLGL